MSHGAATGSVRSLSLDELREVAPELPTLDEALAFFVDEAPEIGLHVDLKLQTRLDELAAALRRYGLERRTVVSSFHAPSLHAVARHADGVRIGFTYPEDRLGVSRRRALQPLVGLGLSSARALVPRLGYPACSIVRERPRSCCSTGCRPPGRSLAPMRRARPFSPGRSIRRRPRARARRGGRRRDHERSAHLRRSGSSNGSFTFTRLARGYTQARMRRRTPVTILACSAALFVALAGPAWADETTPPPDDHDAAHDDEPPPPALGPKLIEPGVTIGGLLVGGLTGPEARELVEERFDRPVRIVVSTTRKLSVPSAGPRRGRIRRQGRQARRARPDARSSPSRSGSTSRSRSSSASSRTSPGGPIASRSTPRSPCGVSCRSPASRSRGVASSR